MIRLNVNEQQLFDLIMAVYAAASAEGSQQDAETAKRRDVLLDKLHRAFDNKIMATQADRAGSAVARAAHAAAQTGPRLPMA